MAWLYSHATTKQNASMQYPGGSGGDRTHDNLLKRQVLLPTELPTQVYPIYFKAN